MRRQSERGKISRRDFLSDKDSQDYSTPLNPDLHIGIVPLNSDNSQVLLVKSGDGRGWLLSGGERELDNRMPGDVAQAYA